MRDASADLAPWCSSALGELLSLEYGTALKEGARTSGTVPVYGSNGQVGWHDRPLVEGPGIVVGRKGSVGKLAWSENGFWPIDTAYFVSLRKKLEWRWLFWLLQELNLERLNASTGVPGLNRNDVYRLRVDEPPPDEQRHIAEILDTIDTAIRETETVVATLRQVKLGLLHDLLTYGLDAHGHRRDPTRHPEQFQVGVIDRIPREWRTKPLGEALDLVMDYRGRTPKKLGMHWGEGEIPALSAKNVSMGGIDLKRETYYGSQALYDRWMTSGHVALSDILLTLEAPLGNVAWIPDDRRYILSQRVVLLRPNPSDLDKVFLRYQLTTDRFQRAMRHHATGTTATGIQRSKLETIPVLIPSNMDEQRHIAEHLLSQDAVIDAEEENIAKLRAIRRGFAHDLLTGRVRVKA